MANKYRSAHDGSDFVVNYDVGVTVGAYETEQEAKLEIEVCAPDDFMLETARSLLRAAIDAFMRLHNIIADQRTTGLEKRRVEGLRARDPMS